MEAAEGTSRADACQEVMGDDIVGFYKCGIMRLWNYEIESSRHFHNSTMVLSHNSTIPQSFLSAPCGYDACGEYACQFNGFATVCERIKDFFMAQFTFRTLRHAESLV